MLIFVKIFVTVLVVVFLAAMGSAVLGNLELSVIFLKVLTGMLVVTLIAMLVMFWMG
jgi:hypothetical protein